MSNAGNPVYQNASQPVALRVKDLLSRMTLEEKAAQMTTFSVGRPGGGLLQRIPEEERRSFMIRMGAPADFADRPPPREQAAVIDDEGTVDRDQARGTIENNGGGATAGITAFSPEQNAAAANTLQEIAQELGLGIPIMFVGEGLHGHVANGATIFPQAIGLGSTWNPDLLRKIGRVIGTEARAVGTHELFAPVLDLGRDPRWGRTEETYGEDPFLAARLGVAMVQGMQGQRLSDPDAVSCGGKHFGGHGQPLGGRDSNMEGITERDLREIHFQPFEAVVKEADARCIMAAYHAIDGIPCHANYWLLTQILRQEWGYQGHVVSDAGGVEGLQLKHRIAATPSEAVRQTIEAGLDLQLGFGQGFAQSVVELVRKGALAEETVDAAVGWLLKLKFELGLFERPYVDPERAAEICNAPEHRELAREAARQSIVLLKNDDNILPLKDDIGTVLVAGPNADSPYNQLGDYSGSAPIVTILDGIKARVGEDVTIRYVKGSGIKDEATEGIAEAVDAAKESDLAILVLGESSWTEGMTSGEGNDRADLDLPGAQQQLLEAVYETGTPVVLVLINGRPLTVGWAVDYLPAILEAWYPGQEGGHAVAEILWGDSDPGGRLPITFPPSVGQLPFYYNYKPSGRAYDYVLTDYAPLFPFGYGLSYTAFEYSDLTIIPRTIGTAGQVTVSVTVTNVGDRAGDDVVQLYLSDIVSSVVTPVKELKGFERVRLEPGASRTVQFGLGPSELSLLNRHLERVVEPGVFEIQIGDLVDEFEVHKPAGQPADTGSVAES